MVNAFWLDRDLDTAVRWLVDAHVTSSVFECSMVLTTAAQLVGLPEDDALYFTHANNPLTQWAARSHGNWRRLHAYVEAAHAEWQYRWDHDPEQYHACWETVVGVDDAVRDLDWPATGRTDPPQLTGDWQADDYVEAYRLYYANDKRHLFEWAKDRSEPPWIAEYTEDGREHEADTTDDE